MIVKSPKPWGDFGQGVICKFKGWFVNSDWLKNQEAIPSKRYIVMKIKPKITNLKKFELLYNISYKTTFINILK